jgi:hypothetical protein
MAHGGPFNGNLVRRLFRLMGLGGAPAGVGDAPDLPGRDERWLPDLAAELGVKPIVVHRWRWSEWLLARQLPGEIGRWIVSVGRDEVRRLGRLRRHELENRGWRTPPELTTPEGRRTVS